MSTNSPSTTRSPARPAGRPIPNTLLNEAATQLPTPEGPSPLNQYLTPLRLFLNQEGVTEIAINRPCEVWVERHALWHRYDLPETNVLWAMQLARLIASRTKQWISTDSPLLAAELPGGERIQIVIPPACPEGQVSLTIRRPSPLTLKLQEFADAGMFEETVAANSDLSPTEISLMALHRGRKFLDFLEQATVHRQNIVVAGATGSGKTTLAKSLIQAIPLHERLIAIEDVPELELPHPNHVRLIYSKGAQGAAQVGPRDLLEASLRMRPDRILLAELRGSEAFFFLRNAASGHPGSITTVHAGSALQAFEQLTLLVKQSPEGNGLERREIQGLLKSLVDIVVYVEKRGGTRRIAEIYYDPEAKRAG
jgi:type IV secretion system protein VirB11